MRHLAFLIAVLASTGSASADKIFLTDGTTIGGASCKIQEETLLVVSYKEGNNRGEVSSDKVLSIEFSAKPPIVDRAEAAIAEDAIRDAVFDFEDYIAGVLDKEPTRYKWAKAYSMYRLVDLNAILGESEAVAKAADQLLEHAPESRYVPLVYLKKIEAQTDLGQDPKKTIEDFSDLIEDKGLSQRWKLERDLAQMLNTPASSADKHRKNLRDLAGIAGDSYPTVKNRAKVSLAESFLEGNVIPKAEELFGEVTAAPKADERTLAAAHSGLGDCLRARAEKDGNSDKELLEKALLSYMRVVVVYKNELRYAPRAMFYAGRVLDAIGDEVSLARAQKMYLKVQYNFPTSRWADEAKGFYRK